MLRKILSLTLSFSLLFQYSGFAQSINLADYLSQGSNTLALDRFRPLALRYFSYEPSVDNFKILLDKGDQKDLSDIKIKNEADKLLTYFKIGLTLPNEKFWVNLRPDAADQIIDPELEKTDLGKVLLESDLQLKKDTSSLTSPQSKEGKAYWDKLYKKAGELFGTENITIPTLTRPWIVPGEIIVRESKDSAYIYKAVLKVMLEEDYLSRGGFEPAPTSDGSRTAPTYQQYAFSDPRLKELNKYSTELIRETILPELTKRINSSKDYANLRQVFFSLILARWFKDSFSNSGSASAPENSYIKLIDSQDLTNLTSKEAWSKTAYFNEYKKSFKDGEYNLSEKVHTPTGQSIRRYTSGGGNFIDFNPGVFKTAGSAINIEDGNKTLLNIEAGQLNIQKTAASAAEHQDIKLPLTQPRLNFSDLKSLEASLKGIVEEVSPGVIYAGTFMVINEAALKNELIDKLVYDATFNPNQDIVNETRRLIKGIAVSLGAKPDSTYNLYLEKAKDQRHYTIPAINIRGMAYNTARAVFESAVRNKVEDPFILEIARSEIGYTAQRPAEYTTSVLAAAIKEGYKLPVYLQGDHFQITAKELKENLPAAIEKVQKLIREAIEAGFYQIDLDTSTLVDWFKPTADEQQNLNYTMAAKLTAYVRLLEKDLGLDKQGIVVNLGGEIGEIGMGLEKDKERNSSVEDLRAFMNGYNAELEKLGKELGFRINPITKVAVQSGTKHGGVRDSAGKVIKAKVGFNTLAELGKAAREEFGLAGVVQHGASTLPEDYFTVFAGNKMPAGLTIDESLLNQEGQATLDKHPVAEVHLATAYQDTVLDHPEFPADLREEIVKRILEWNPPKEGQDPNKVFVDNRKNAWGEFKLQTWNMPSDIQTAMRNSLRVQFDTVFKNLGVAQAAGSPATIMVLANNLSLLEGAQTRGYNVSHAILDEYNGGILNHSEARFNLEVKIENALKSIFSETYNFKNDHLALAPAEETIWKQTLKTEGISDVEYAEYFSFEKDGYLSRPHIGVTDKARHIVNRIINLQLKKVIASTRGDKGYKNVRQVVLCVGETLAQREPARKNIILDEDAVNTLIQEGMINAVIEEDIKDMLKGITKEDARSIGLRIAYEPRWAIGTGKTPTTDEIQRVHRFIKDTLSQGSVLGIELDIDYGGSLKSKNAWEILHSPDVDGGLIGGAAKTVSEIEPIIKEAIIQGEEKGKILNIGMNWKAETKGTGLASLESFAEFFKNSSLDLSKVTIAIGTPQVGIVKSAIASSAMMAAEKTVVPGQPAKVLGGIDFRQMNMLIQPQGSFASSSLDFSLPALSKAEIEAFDLDKELELIQRMASSGIDPIDERLKKYLAVCFARGKVGKEIDELKLCLEDVFTAQQLDARETPDGYKEVIVIADTRRYVVKESRLAAGKSNVINLN